MARMLIEDSFTAPGGGVAVTGRPDGDLRRGDRLRLTTNGAAGQDVTHEVTVARVLRLCGRRPDGVAPHGMNAAVELDGVPPGLHLPGLTLRTE
ncbi:hypothetical protein AB0H83_19490 [Dactylosporangium sp. NPDC050688]|uniref:hypothetical protein n=1 Tax=Dactylosporangium sp. NPDC050688 TaxID=3157217 RepID=UPI0033D1360D